MSEETTTTFLGSLVAMYQVAIYLHGIANELQFLAVLIFHFTSKITLLKGNLI